MLGRLRQPMYVTLGASKDGVERKVTSTVHLQMSHIAKGIR